MRLLTLLCPVLCLLAGGALAAHDRTFCEITQPSGVMLPASPTVYTVMMSMRDENGERTSAMEYYDGTTQRTSFQANTAEGSFRAVVNFVTNQVQVVKMNETRMLLDACKVTTIVSPDVLTPVTFGSKMYMLPSKFFFGGGGVNVGIDTSLPDIDGTPLNSFASCYYWSGRDTSLKITWHFTKTTPVQPLRVIVNGKDNSNGRVFTLTHDITRFAAGNPSWAARFNPYMSPPGLYCRNLNSQGRKPQTLPDRFSMRIERIGQGANTSTYMREAYDFKANMSLLLGYPPETSGDSAKYGAGRLLYIHDFRRGLSYIRNEDMGNCTYEKLSSTDWDSQKDGNQLRIRTAREFFDLDTENVQYKGTGYTRDILTDVFINYKQLELAGAGTGLKFDTTIEWYFANRTVVDPETKAPIIQSIPMSVLISSDAFWINSWMYIYDFDEKDPSFNRHDISACFSIDAKKHFQIYFPLENDELAKYITKSPNDFTSLLVPIIASGLNVSPLRVLDPEVTVYGWTAILELTVTDKPKFQSDTDETALNQIEAAFNLLVDKGFILTAVSVNKKFYVVTANKVTIVEERTSNLKSIGYSAGAVAGAAIGLLLAGLLAGIIAAFFYWR